MKRLLTLTIVLTLCIATTMAQRLFYSEIAESAITQTDPTNILPFHPSSTTAIGDPDPHLAVDHIVDIPRSWSDKRVFLHLESVAMGYRVCVNGVAVAQCDDPYLPAEYEITEQLDSDFNIVTIELGRSSSTSLNQGIARKDTPQRGRFDNCYYFTRERLDVVDYDASLRPDTVANYALLNISAIIENREDSDKKLSVGYYMQNPAGQVIVSNMVDNISIASGGCDTIRFERRIKSSEAYRWSAQNPKLYKLTMVTKTEGRTYRSPIRDIALIDYRNLSDSLRTVRYNAINSRERSFRELDSLKSLGYNTIRPDYPQPKWLYDRCSQIGIYIIDRANINAPTKNDDRTIGGTPSNDPQFVNEYIARVKGCYMRTRNTPSVIAYSLGGDSGNGYNMYKAYEWLKGIELERPVIYEGAEGEWNSDNLEFAQDEH